LNKVITNCRHKAMRTLPPAASFWINVVGYQIVWFAAIIGAGRGLWWPGLIAAAVFIVQHIAIGNRQASGRAIDLRLLAVAVLIGILLDGTLARSDLADYAGDAVTLPTGGAPLWILAMWASFALTLRHSMFILIKRPSVAFVVGAVFGPLAYLGAGRAWSAVTLAAPQWQPLAALSFGWGVALLVLALLVRHWSASLAMPAIAEVHGAA
jgi:Protein of unknown function (DUF2878)